MKFRRATYLQGLLQAKGLPLQIDGQWGPLSQEALDAFALQQHLSVNPYGVVSRKVLKALREAIPRRTHNSMRSAARKDFRESLIIGAPHSTSAREMVRAFGHPNQNMLANVEKVVPAYTLYYRGQPVRYIRVHYKAADAFRAVFTEILQVYGQAEIERLGLDQYTGTYSKRPIRGGQAWSTHAYLVAIDMNAARNLLGWDHTQALFAKPEYDKFRAIWRKHGFVNLGEALDYDWQHFQWCSI